MSGGAHPAVSVIVPVHGNRGELAAALTALAGQDYAGEVQVIVVDNGDNHDLPASGGGVEVVAEPVRSSYAARNAGVARSRGTVLAFTDADCRPAASWLSAGVAALREAPAVGGRIDVQLGSQRATGAALWDRLHGLRQDTYVLRDGYAATANLLVTRELFDAVGPFDGGLRSGGDREWGERALRRGTRIAYRPEVVVHHPARDSLSELQRKALRLHRGSAALRASRGEPALSATDVAHGLIPHSRSVLRHARRLGGEGFGAVERARYIAVAHWLQYFSFGARIRAAFERRGR